MIKARGVLDHIPDNLNYLSPLGFQFTLKRAAHVNFFLQEVVIPGLILPKVDEATPFVNLPQAGDHVTFEPLVATFIVDEDLQNFFEIQTWMRGIGKVNRYEDYAAIAVNKEYTGLGVKSEITLTILDSAKNPNYTFVFHECWPTQISGLTFSSTTNDIKYLVCTATFEYSTYDWEVVVKAS